MKTKLKERDQENLEKIEDNKVTSYEDVREGVNHSSNLLRINQNHRADISSISIFASAARWNRP